MASNIDIDQKKLEELKRLGKFKSKKETVNAALDEYLKKLKRRQVVAAFGTIEFDEDWDYRKLRGKK